MTSGQGREVELEHLNGHQINHDTILLLPLGSHEYHGYHAPLGTDSIIAFELAKAIAQKGENRLVLPVVNYAYSRIHDNYQGTISVRPSTALQMLQDILESIAKQGVRRLLIVNGHDGNVPFIDLAATEVRRAHPKCVMVATTWWQISREADFMDGLFGAYGGKGHGGAEEVAIVQALRRGQVDLTIADPAPITGVAEKRAAPFLRHDLYLIYQDIAEITQKPYEGVPQEASAEKGERIFDYLVRQLDDFLCNYDWHLTTGQDQNGQN